MDEALEKKKELFSISSLVIIPFDNTCTYFLTGTTQYKYRVNIIFKHETLGSLLCNMKLVKTQSLLCWKGHVTNENCPIELLPTKQHQQALHLLVRYH